MTLAELQRALRWLRISSLSVDISYDTAGRPAFFVRATRDGQLVEFVETTLEAAVIGLLGKVSA